SILLAPPPHIMEDGVISFQEQDAGWSLAAGGYNVKMHGGDDGRGICDLEGDSWTRWMHEVRRMEFEGTVRHVPLGSDSAVLELGSGDGFRTALLRERFDRVFSIDPEHAPEAGERRFAFAVAEALPFGEESPAAKDVIMTAVCRH
ncbi:MAG: hypothetical protein KGM47_18280, partial [Acidobacteriota bacterium]|nr:hypothetical protein [Acidobacteriota bacterium]